MNTLGLFPSQDGVFTTPTRENLFTAKGSANITPSQYLSVRYGRNTNSQVYGATTRRVQDSWGDSTNKFNSINMNHNWVLGGSKLNEFVFQYADFGNHVTARTGAGAGDVPERRHHRLQQQHAADDRTAQVPVQGRLLVEPHGRRRPRPRLQGRRQLHQRAAPLRHVLVGLDRLRLHAPDERSGRPDQRDHAATSQAHRRTCR